jgi:hypothetical protein
MASILNMRFKSTAYEHRGHFFILSQKIDTPWVLCNYRFTFSTSKNGRTYQALSFRASGP